MEDQSAVTFEETVEKYGDFVYNVALRMMGNPHDAEEVAQEAFIDAFRAWERFRGESQVSTWLYRITVNRSLMRLRKEKRARELTQTGYDDAEIANWARSPDSPEREALRGELGEKLEEGLNLLPPDLRAAVVLRDIQGLSNEEASEAQGISIPALKARLHRGRVLLQKVPGSLRPHSGPGLEPVGKPRPYWEMRTSDAVRGEPVPC